MSTAAYLACYILLYERQNMMVNHMNPLLNNRFGCWISNGIPFDSKIQALIHANRTNAGGVSFYYHNHVWDSVDRSLLGKRSLPSLYKERAQQLRDNYDYLVLHYSGGSDSHNILHTFLTNNIKLDEVTVRWVKPLMDGQFYTPNTQDTSARNAASEWDFAIKPTLKMLAEKHPDIKINVVEYAFDLKTNNLSTDNLIKTVFNKKAVRGGLGTLSMIIDPNVENKMLDINKKGIAHIFGVEKPVLYLRDNTICMQFMDGVFEHTMPIRDMDDGSVVEPFYWTPDLPLLALEMAYQSALYFKTNTEARNHLWGGEVTAAIRGGQIYEQQGLIHKMILYKDSWNPSTFQVSKPNPIRSDWYFWLWENPEFKSLVNNFRDAMSEVATNFDRRAVMVTEQIPVMVPSHTKLFPILNLNDTIQKQLA